MSLVEHGDKMDHFYSLRMLVDTEACLDQHQRHELGSPGVSQQQWSSSGHLMITGILTHLQVGSKARSAPCLHRAAGLTHSHLQRHLSLLFKAFIDDEVKWISGSKVTAKRAGVLVGAAMLVARVTNDCRRRSPSSRPLLTGWSQWCTRASVGCAVM